MTSVRRSIHAARRKLSPAGLLAVAIVATAAYLAVVVLLGGSLHSGGGGEAARQTPERPSFPASDYDQSRFPKLGARPLLGMSYTHYALPLCRYAGPERIFASYHRPGVARKVHSQLYQMRKAGFASIRTNVWYMTDPTGVHWGPVSSAGGRLREPYRTNLIRLATEIRRFGFRRLTVLFAPVNENNPRLGVYKLAKFQENWRFIRSVRALVKRYGPADTKFDLLAEGAPSEAPTPWTPLPQQTADYIRKMYRLYVERFGNRDITVSTVFANIVSRLRNLVRILKSSGEAMPPYYDIRLGYEPPSAATAFRTLREVDAVLGENGQHQPIVIGETAYHNRPVAMAISRFLAQSSRRIDEISQWYLRDKTRGCQISPPYKPGAYGREFQASPR
jgi:hypothetical protein